MSGRSSRNQVTWCDSTSQSTHRSALPSVEWSASRIQCVASSSRHLLVVLVDKAATVERTTSFQSSIRPLGVYFRSMSEEDALHTWSQGDGPPRVQRSQSLSVSTGICLFRHCGDRANSESWDSAGSAKRKEDSSRKHRRAPVTAVASYFNSRSKGKGVKVIEACSPAFPLSALRGPNHQTQLRTPPPPPPSTGGDRVAEGDVQTTSNCGSP